MERDELFEEKKEEIVHVHVLHRHISSWIAISIFFILAFAVGFASFSYARITAETIKLMVLNGKNENIAFLSGSWPALGNINFFEDVRQDFISQKADFIEVNLTSMTLHVYRDGNNLKEVEVLSKGREGSWWETPAGLYQVKEKVKNAYSSFGQVFMPWSMQFQGNFFIHGWPYFPDGTPVPKGHSGGCIRLSTEDAKEVFDLSKKGMPVLVFEESFNGSEVNIPMYEQKKPEVSATHYLAADLGNNFIFTKNMSDMPYSIASITKLLTALITVEYINVEKEIEITSQMMASTSVQRLREGDVVSVLDLLSLLLVESSNEAAVALTAPLGEDQFIELMNEKSGAIGMKNSYFVDSSGVSAHNRSTAEDLFMLAKYLYYNRSFILDISVGEENRSAYDSPRYDNLSNFNLILDEKGLIGAKTGTSNVAKEAMFTIFEMKIGKETRPVAVVILGSENRKKDVETIYRYIRTNFEI